MWPECDESLHDLYNYIQKYTKILNVINSSRDHGYSSSRDQCVSSYDNYDDRFPSN